MGMEFQDLRYHQLMIGKLKLVLIKALAKILMILRKCHRCSCDHSWNPLTYLKQLAIFLQQNNRKQKNNLVEIILI